MKTAPQKKLILTLSFVLPAGLMALVFALCGLVPFGQRTLGVMDMAHQYLPFLCSLRDILSGNEGLLYLPSMCLGGNMLGVAAYYLTSPLNLFTCLFPRENLYTAVSLLFFLRVGLCGLTMCLYAGRRRGYGWRNLAAALAYAFMAYMLAYSFNYLWQDCVILLPVLALGIVRLNEEQRPFLYLLTLAVCLFLNFYIGYILCLFSVLFFLYEFFSRPREERTAPGRTFLTFVLASLAAGALAAVMLLPAFLSLAGGKAEFSLSVLTLTPKFPFVRMLSKFYPGAFVYEEIMPDGLPQIFCGTVTVTLTILYFANRRIPLRRRLLTGGLMLVFILSFWIAGLDLIWHCLNTPSWYNYRYSFLLSFLMAAAADRELLEGGEDLRLRRFFLPVIVAAVGAVLAFWGQTYDYAGWPVAAILIAAGISAALYLLRRPGTGKGTAAVILALILLVHGGELTANARLSLGRLTAQTTDEAAFADYAVRKGAALALVPDDGTYVRTESPVFFDQDRCEPMLFGYDGLSHYGSTIDQENLEFLDRLGLDRYQDLWSMYGPGVTSAADTLLGIRYLVSDTLSKEYAPLGETEGYTVYENPAALPIGWTADEAIAREMTAGDSFAYTSALYASAAPEVEGAVFAAAETEPPILENFTAEGARYARQGDGAAVITWTVVPTSDGPLYAEFDIPDFPGVMLFVDGVPKGMYASAQTNGTVFLGNCAAGDRVEVRLQAFSDITLESASFATENTAVLERYAAALAAGGCALRKLSSSHYEGSFTAGEGDEYLVLTIPFDVSWSVRLDGVPVQAERVQSCLTTLSVSPGQHTIELRYVPAGLLPGACVSAVALAGILFWFVLRKKRGA